VDIIKNVIFTHPVSIFSAL